MAVQMLPCASVILGFSYFSVKPQEGELKVSLGGDVSPRPSNPDLFKTKSVHFATLFKTRDLFT